MTMRNRFAMLALLALPTVATLRSTLAQSAVRRVVPSSASRTTVAIPMPEAEVHRRATELLAKMTSEEKIGQLSVIFALGTGKSLMANIAQGDVGSILFATDASLTNKLQHQAVDGSRLHIPLLFGFDVVHGLRTLFPVPIAMAASWDPAAVEHAQSVSAEEASAVGVRWVYAPMVDIARDPRWGRMVEGAGEDPFLGSAMAAAQVRGFQGPYLGAPSHVVACVKHFAGYGAAEGGRDYDAADISDDQLWNVYFPPFQSAVKAGVGSLMSAYMDLNGIPASGNKWLLRDVLRDQWHFGGFVVSDNFAVRDLKTHGFARDTDDAALRAFQAGVNVEMALSNTAYSKSLPKALSEGKITNEQLDDAVRPVLETKIRLGLFEHPYVDEAAAAIDILSKDHRDESRKMAERTAVLLRNEGGLLPLNPERYKKIAIVGPLADSKFDVDGSWAFAAKGDESISVLAGLQNHLNGAQLSFVPGVQIKREFASGVPTLGKPKQVVWSTAHAEDEFKKAVKVAAESDLTIMVVGESEEMSGEVASRSSLSLPGGQEELIEAVVASGKPVVLVLMNGRPLDISWASLHVPAILEAWYPGSEAGNAIANLLTGNKVPGGKLPFTWPRSADQIPMFYAHTLSQSPATQKRRYWDAESTPLFPFGFGLSYADFTFSDIKVNKESIAKGDTIEVSATVTNTSATAGDAVAQLYLHQQYGTSSRPIRELKGFRRLSLAAHEQRSVSFTIGKDELSYWNSASKSVVQDDSTFDVWLGSDSTASLHTEFNVKP
jgi:beta-glucosidase